MAEAFTQYYRAKGSVWKDWGLVWMRACRQWNDVAKTGRGLSVAEENLALWRKRLDCKFWLPFWGARVGEPGCQVPRELLP